MIKILKKDFGYHLVYTGSVTEDDMKSWVTKSKNILSFEYNKFGVLVDMTALDITLQPDVQYILHQGQKLYLENGMVRSCVVVNNPILDLHIKTISKQTGIYENERYINSNIIKNWEEVAINWIVYEIEPKEIQ